MTRHLVFVEAKAQKQFKRVPMRYQARIIEVLNTLEKEGLSARLDIKMLRGVSEAFSYKVGGLPNKI